MDRNRIDVMWGILCVNFKVRPDDFNADCAYRLEWGWHHKALITMRVAFNDSLADAVITNMTNIAVEEGKSYDAYRNQGLGTLALGNLKTTLKTARCTIGAAQVQTPSESFWLKNGFEPLNNSTNDYIYKG